MTARKSKAGDSLAGHIGRAIKRAEAARSLLGTACTVTAETVRETGESGTPLAPLWQILALARAAHGEAVSAIDNLREASREAASARPRKRQ